MLVFYFLLRNSVQSSFSEKKIRNIILEKFGFIIKFKKNAKVA